MDANIIQNAQALLMTVMSIAGGSGIFAVKKIFDYLTTKTAIINDSEARDVANNALSILDNLLETNITYAENVLKQPIIDAIADGKVTKDELKSLGDIVKTNVLSQMTEDTKTALGKIVIDIESFIGVRLESILGNLKIDNSSSVSKTTVEAPAQPVVDTIELESKVTMLVNANSSLSDINNELANEKNKLQQSYNELNVKNQELLQELQAYKDKLSTITQVVIP